MEGKPIRVLQIAGGFNKGVSGGVAAFLNNYYRYIDKRKYHFDFLSISYQCFELYREELEQAGSSLYCLGVTDYKGIRGKLKYIRGVAQFVRQHEFDIIHINMGTFFTVLFCSLTVKMTCRAKIIAHCHNNIVYPPLKKAVINLFKPLFPKTADYFCTCSLVAAEYMFPQSVLKGSRFSVMKNAIDCDQYVFNQEIRAAYRKLWGIEDQLLIVHVGRFNTQKNHRFMIDIFNEICKKDHSVKLIFIGTGELMEQIQHQIDQDGISEKVILAGQRADINHCLQAADIFLMPSLFEGLPVAVLEAQAAGLPVVLSDVITKEADITKLLKYKSLTDSAESWAEEVLSFSKQGIRRNTSVEIAKAGYDVKQSARHLTKIYTQLMTKGTF